MSSAFDRRAQRSDASRSAYVLTRPPLARVWCPTSCWRTADGKRRVADHGRVVLDASALLCLFFREPGADRVEARMSGAYVSAANLAEVVAKLVDRGVDGAGLVADIAELDLKVMPLDRAQAEAAGLLRATTREAGLSLGDRCCLALAQSLGATALTTDRAWKSLSAAIAVEVVR